VSVFGDIDIPTHDSQREDLDVWRLKPLVSPHCDDNRQDIFTRCRLGSLPHLYHRVRVGGFRRAADQDLRFLSLSCQGPGQVECTAGFVSSQSPSEKAMVALGR
jgi:hypothetical protein